MLIAGLVAGILAAWVWHRTSQMPRNDAGLTEGVLGFFGGLGMFMGLAALTVILLAAAGVAWVVSLF